MFDFSNTLDDISSSQDTINDISLKLMNPM